VTSACPAPAELLPYALRPSGAPAGEEIAAHVAACPSCSVEVQRLREAATALRGIATSNGVADGRCLDELTIAAVADGELPPAQRTEVITHLSACPHCRRQVAGITRLLRDPSVAAAQRGAASSAAQRPGDRSGTYGGRFGGVGALVGLAAAVLVLVVTRSDHAGRATVSDAPATTRHVLRERPITTTAAPRLIAPAGATSLVDTLRWTSVPHADRYRATVFDGDGNVAHEAETADTAVGLPPQFRAARGRLYLWKVEARTGWDRWVESELGEFTVLPAPMPER
jgi:anti-sigma factor RsiW